MFVFLLAYLSAYGPYGYKKVMQKKVKENLTYTEGLRRSKKMMGSLMGYGFNEGIY